jgi:hypothetical protein
MTGEHKNTANATENSWVCLLPTLSFPEHLRNRPDISQFRDLLYVFLKEVSMAGVIQRYEFRMNDEGGTEVREKVDGGDLRLLSLRGATWVRKFLCERLHLPVPEAQPDVSGRIDVLRNTIREGLAGSTIRSANNLSFTIPNSGIFRERLLGFIPIPGSSRKNEAIREAIDRRLERRIEMEKDNQSIADMLEWTWRHIDTLKPRMDAYEAFHRSRKQFFARLPLHEPASRRLINIIDCSTRAMRAWESGDIVRAHSLMDHARSLPL